MLLLFIIIFGLFFAGWYFFVRGKSTPSITSKKSEKEIRKITPPQFFTASVLLLILGVNLFLYSTFSPISFPVVGFALFNIFSVVSLLLVISKRKYSPILFLLSLVSIASGAFLVFRTNGFVQSINVFVMLGIGVILLFVHVYDQIYIKGLWLLRNMFSLVPKTFGHILTLFQQHKVQGKKKFAFLSVLKTVAITLVVFVFFVMLLSSADPIFSQIIEKVRDELVGRTFVSLFIAFVATIVLTLQKKSKEENTYTFGWFSFNDIFIPVISIALLFGVFLVIQAQYLFGGHADLASFNLTYSEYVRKGFTELLFTAFFGGIIAYVVMIKSRLLSQISKVKQLQIVNGIVLVELFFMLLSALKRDFMYVETYGLTRVRIVGGLFLFWLAGSLLIIGLLTVAKRIQEKYLFVGVGVLSLVVWLALNVLNVDMMVVRGTPQHHDYKDHFYIVNLSEDAVAGWKNSAETLQQETKELLSQTELSDEQKSRLAGNKLALIALQEQREELYTKYGSDRWILENCEQINCEEYRWRRDKEANKDDQKIEIRERIQRARSWQHWSYTEKKAYDLVNTNYNLFFTQVDQLLEDIRNYQLQNNIDLYEQERWLLKEFEYPFIEINLDYYPERLESYSSPRTPDLSFSEDQKEFIQQSSSSVASLVNQTCDTSLQSVEIVGMVKMINTVEEGILENYQWYSVWDGTSTGEDKTLSIVTPRSSDISQELGQCLECGPKFGRLTLQAQNIQKDDSCSVFYNIVDWEEIKRLS